MSLVYKETLRRLSMLSAGLMLLLQAALPMTALADGSGSPDACLDATANVVGSVEGTADLVTYNAGSGNTVDGVCIKSGNNMFGDAKHSNVLGNGTYSGQSADGSPSTPACYTVSGVGTQSVTVTRVGSGDNCQGLSHIDVIVKPVETTVEVIKKLNPTNDEGKFDLRVESQVEADDVGHNGTTGKVDIDDTENISVDEVAGTNTLLTDYSTTVECRDEDGQGSVIDSSTPTGTTSRGLIIEADKIEAGDEIVCIITNTRNQEEPEDPSLTVIKHVINDDGGSATVNDFDIEMNNSDLSFGAGVANGDTTSYTATPTVEASTDYTLSEIDLGGYSEGTWSCDDGTQGTGLEATVNLDEGEDVTCEITNNDIKREEEPKGSIKIIKDVEDGKDAQDFEFEPDWDQEPNFFLDDDDDGTLQDSKLFSGLGAGTYKVTELETSGWELDDIDCEAEDWDADDNTVTIELQTDEDVVCVFTNDKEEGGGGGNPDKGKIKGHKFNDVDGDGTWDNGEETLEGFTIELYSCASVLVDVCITPTLVTTDVTDENGAFEFSNVDPGDYLVCEVQKDGWIQTLPANDACWLVEKDEFRTGDCVVDFGNKAKKPGKVRGVTTPPELAPTGTSLLQGLIVGMSILGSAAGVTFLTRREQSTSTK